MKIMQKEHLSGNFTNPKGESTRVIQRILPYTCGFFSTFLFFYALRELFHEESKKLIVSCALIAFVLIVGFIILCSLGERERERESKSKSQSNHLLTLITKIAIAFVFIVQLIIAHEMILTPDVDLSHLIEQYRLIENSSSPIFTLDNYFGTYPNNIPLGILLYWLFKGAAALGFSNIGFIGGLFNVCMLLCSYCSFFGILRIYTNEKVASMATMVLLANPWYYAYASYYYTDIISIGFLMLATFLLAKASSQQANKAVFIFYFLSGFFYVIAASIRITSIFLPLSICFYLAINKHMHISYLKAVAALALGAIVALGSVTQLITFHFPYDTKDTAVPFTHFIMMGSNADTGGKYANHDDLDFTQSFTTHEEKMLANLDITCQRINNQGFLRNCKLAIYKEGYVWSTWHKGYKQFTKHVEQETPIYNIIRGSNASPFQIYMRAYNLFLLGLIAVSLFLGSKRINEYNIIGVLAIYWILGVLFYLLWEASCRHSLSFFIPLTALLAPFIQYCLTNPGKLLRKKRG